MEKIDRFSCPALAKAKSLLLIILKDFFAWANLKCQVMHYTLFHFTFISTINKLNQICASVDCILKHLSTGEVCWFYISIIN